MRASKLELFKRHIHQRWGEGCTNARQIHREITSLGSQVSYHRVHDYLQQHRPAPAPTEPPRPTVRQVTAWLTRHPDRLTQDDKLHGLRRVLGWSCCCH